MLLMGLLMLSIMITCILSLLPTVAIILLSPVFTIAQGALWLLIIGLILDIRGK